MIILAAAVGTAVIVIVLALIGRAICKPAEQAGQRGAEWKNWSMYT